MEFSFETPPAIVHEKRKYANFTVRDIGGPAEIIIWRQQQEAKESLYRLKLGERDKRLSAFESESGQKLDKPKIVERTWEEKTKDAAADRESYEKAMSQVIEYPPWEYVPKPKQNIFQILKGFIRKLWNNSNF